MSSEAVTTIVLAIASWVVSGAITLGFMKSKIADFERRISQSEADNRQLQRDFMQHQLECARHRGAL